jgi:hypothetical protein
MDADFVLTEGNEGRGVFNHGWTQINTDLFLTGGNGEFRSQKPEFRSQKTERKKLKFGKQKAESRNNKLLIQKFHLRAMRQPSPHSYPHPLSLDQLGLTRFDQFFMPDRLMRKSGA